MLETDREELKAAQVLMKQENNVQISDLVRQIVYLRKQLEIQKLQLPEMTHVQGLNQNINQSQKPKKRRENRKNANNKRQFSF